MEIFSVEFYVPIWAHRVQSSKGDIHNDSLWYPLHTKEGDEISMFWGPCLQSSISTLSFSFLALFFCYAVSSCVYDHNHPYLVSERLFLAENKAFPYLRRALAHPRRAPGYTLRCSGDLTCGHFRGRGDEAEKPKNERSLRSGTGRSITVPIPAGNLNGHCGVIFQSIFKPNTSLERSCPDLNEHVLFLSIERETAERRPFEVC